jgi:hypothetical protein
MNEKLFPRNDYVRKTFPNKRFKHTLEFLNKHISPTQTILDLGVENPFQESWKKKVSRLPTQVVKI